MQKKTTVMSSLKTITERRPDHGTIGIWIPLLIMAFISYLYEVHIFYYADFQTYHSFPSPHPCFTLYSFSYLWSAMVQKQRISPPDVSSGQQQPSAMSQSLCHSPHFISCRYFSISHHHHHKNGEHDTVRYFGKKTTFT